MTTHQEALEAAREAIAKLDRRQCGTAAIAETAIRAYISTLAPADNGLVERLQAFADEAEIGGYLEAAATYREAADTITAQAAEIERLKADYLNASHDASSLAGKLNAAEARAAALQTLLVEAVEKEKHSFQVGYTLAVANLINLHDQPGMAADVMAQSGITLADIEAMDLTEYDLNPLREMFQEEGVLRETAIQEAV